MHYLDTAQSALDWSFGEASRLGFVDSQGRVIAHNNLADAERHAYWSALLNRRIGTTSATMWTNAHESTNGSAQELAEGCMDQFNNAVGRSIDNAHPTAWLLETQGYIQQAGANGQLQSTPGC
jgi:hypothetical protein